MACCKCCCGGEDCAEGQEGKCCCGGSGGVCCQPGEYCCSGVCEPTPCGCESDEDCPEGQVCCDGVCQEPPCPTGACCEEGETGWECRVCLESECNGDFSGAGTTCEEVDCAEDCCCYQDDPCQPLKQFRWSESKCLAENGSFGECSEDEEAPTGPAAVGLGGEPSSVTVTVSGVSTTDPDYQDLVDALNASHVLDMTASCPWAVTQLVGELVIDLSESPGSNSCGTGCYKLRRVFIFAGVSSGYSDVSASASIGPSAGFSGGEENYGGVATSTFTPTGGETYACGWEVFDLSGYPFGPTPFSDTANGNIDFSNATVTLS